MILEPKNIKSVTVSIFSPSVSIVFDFFHQCLIVFVSKMTAYGDCSHEIKKMLVPWKKSYDQPREHIKKQRHFSDKVHLAKAMVFPVVMYGCELDNKES